MLNAKKLGRGFAALIVFLAAAADAAETRFVQSKKADLLLQPKFGAPVVGTLEQGAALTLIEQQGSWLLLQTGSLRGWTSKLLVGPNPPMKKVSALEQIDEEVALNARRRASDVTAAGATRGLTADERRRASQEDAADFEALSRIEQWRVEDSELESFLGPVRGRP